MNRRRVPSFVVRSLIIWLLAWQPLPAEEFFFEDFEPYFDDTELTEFGEWQIIETANPVEVAAQWTILNLGTRANPPTENGAPGFGQFLISDSDRGPGDADGQGTGRSHDLLSPEFSTEGSAAVWLHFDCSAQLNNNGTAIFDVDVSTDGGGSWTNVFRRIAPSRTVAPLPTRENADGFFGRLHLDISDVAQDSDSVTLRFRHFEPDWDWWVAIDEIVVDDEPHVGGLVPLLARETFDQGIPADWEVRSLVEPPNEGSETWSTEDACAIDSGGVTERGVNRLAAPFAIINSDCDPDPVEDEWLVTPTIDASSATEVFLQFASEIVMTATVQEVLLSLDGGVTFEVEPVFSYDPTSLFDGGEEPYFARRILEVPLAAGEPEIAFAFHYASTGNQWWWAIDDVEVTANGELDCTCACRELRATFVAPDEAVELRWNTIPGDGEYQVLADGQPLGGRLPAGTTSFTHADPAVGATIDYTLETYTGDELGLVCTTGPFAAFSVPSALECCVSQESSSVALSWEPGTNIPGQRVLRDGDPIGDELAPGVAEFTDTDVPTGRHEYRVVATGAAPDSSPACVATITGVPLEFADECGGVIAQYEFDGDLSSAIGGLDLLPGVAAPLLPGVDEPIFDFETVDIAGQEARVCSYGRGTFFQLFTGFGPNGGGARTNQFTLMMDVMFPAGALGESGWAGFYQANTLNTDDGEWYLRGSDRGIGIGGNYAGRIEDDTWYRIALVVDTVAGTYTSYIDGVQVQQNTGLTLDDRFSLLTVADGAQEGILIFADDNSENSSGLVNSAQIRDVALTPGQVAAFGRASAEGIPPNPTFTCPSDLLCCYDPESRTVTLEWNPGADIPGDTWRVLRDGRPLRTLPLEESSYVDDTVPDGAGKYEYTLTLIGADESLCSTLPLSCAATVADESAIFFDDFDCYETDADLEAAGWSIVEENDPVEASAWSLDNPADRAPPPGEDGTPSSGQFLISDSDFGGTNAANPLGSGMSHDVWSPSFDTRGLNAVWLHMDLTVVLNNNGNAVFDVDVSTDGGATWENRFRRVAPARAAEPLPVADIPEGLVGGPSVGNSDGFYGRLHLDLDAAGEPDVRFRVRHFEPNWDWWVAIDNVLVDSNPVVGGSAVLLAEEDFDDDLPDGWSLDSGLDVPLAPWLFEDGSFARGCGISLLETTGGLFPDTADGRQLHRLGDTYAMVGPDDFCVFGSPQDEFLITPSVDASAAPNVFLHLRSSLFATEAVAEILLSTDGGSTFDRENPIFSYNLGGGMLRAAGNAEVIHGDYIFSVPRAARQADVAFAFHYANPDGIAGWWAIDEVSVTASGDGPSFIRGDADATGQINITDGIFILNFLFLGGPGPGCDDAADADASGVINITDGIFVLNFLFLGGGAPPSPHPNCGTAEGPSAGCDVFPPCP